MPVLLIYILKLSISLAVVYVFYHFALRKLTFYTWNRWYLLGYSLLSFLIAFFNITPLFKSGLLNYNKVPAIDFHSRDISLNKTTTIIQHSWSMSDWCLFIVASGVIVLGLRLLIQYFSFLNIRRRAQLLSKKETRIYHVDIDIIPFSFGNSIFINKHLHSAEDLEEIVRHEFVHVKQRHSIDMLWSELLCIINWYNPFSWLLKRSIRQNLEFIADNKVLEGGMDRKEYQYLLLKVIGNSQFSIASKFNFSSLKKRIAMMNKMKTARIHSIKFLFVLPLVSVLMIAFRQKEHQIKLATMDRRDAARELTLTSVHMSKAVDTIPKTKRSARQSDLDRASDHFLITDKKALVQLRDGKTEEYDLADSVQRQNFEKKYGKIISVDTLKGIQGEIRLYASSSVDEAKAITVVGGSGDTFTVAPTIATVATPVTVPGVNADRKIATTTSVTTKTAITVKGSTTTVVAPRVSSTVSVVDDDAIAISGTGDAIATEDVLVIITRTTSAQQLQDLRKQMKERGYDLSFDKTTYNSKGMLTYISGTIRSDDGHSNFSASDFDKLILATVKEDNKIHFRVDVVDRHKVVI